MPLGTEFDSMQMFIGGDLTLPDTADAMAVAILSDGTRELIVRVDLERGAEAADLPRRDRRDKRRYLSLPVNILLDIDSRRVALGVWSESRISGV